MRNKKGLWKTLSGISVAAVMGMNGMAVSAYTVNTDVLADGTIYTVYEEAEKDTAYYYTPERSDFQAVISWHDAVLRVTCAEDNVEQFRQDFVKRFGDSYQLISHVWGEDVVRDGKTYPVWENSVYPDMFDTAENEFIVTKIHKHGDAAVNWQNEADAMQAVQELMQDSAIRTIEVQTYRQILANGDFEGGVGFYVYADEALTMDDFAWVQENHPAWQLKDLEPVDYYQGEGSCYQVTLDYWSNDPMYAFQTDDRDIADYEWQCKYAFMKECMEMPDVCAVDNNRSVHALRFPYHYETVAAFDNPNFSSIHKEFADMDGNGVVDLKDAAAVLTQYAENSAMTVPLLRTDADGTLMGDVDGDGQVTVKDASVILKMYAENSAGLAD